jgi:hypothetical protein
VHESSILTAYHRRNQPEGDIESENLDLENAHTPVCLFRMSIL